MSDSDEGEEARFTELCREIAENRAERLVVEFGTAGNTAENIHNQMTRTRRLGQALEGNSVASTLELNTSVMAVHRLQSSTESPQSEQMWLHH